MQTNKYTFTLSHQFVDSPNFTPSPKYVNTLILTNSITQDLPWSVLISLVASLTLSGRTLVGPTAAATCPGWTG